MIFYDWTNHKNYSVGDTLHIGHYKHEVMEIKANQVTTRKV